MSKKEHKPICKLYLMKPKEAWFALSKEKQRELIKADSELSRRMMSKLGGRVILFCDCFWSTEDWLMFGLEEYPNIEAVQAYTREFRKMGWFKYFESSIILGTPGMPQELAI